jgi:hypothetical protein
MPISKPEPAGKKYLVTANGATTCFALTGSGGMAKVVLPHFSFFHSFLRENPVTVTLIRLRPFPSVSLPHF